MTVPAFRHVTRIQNASGNSFDVRLANPSGSAVGPHPVHYLVVEEGVYTQAADGITMEAVRFNSTVTAFKNGWTWENRSYTNSYTNPVVLGQVMTYNDRRLVRILGHRQQPDQPAFILVAWALANTWLKTPTPRGPTRRWVTSWSRPVVA